MSSGRPARAPCVCESQRRCGERASRDGGAGLCVWICSPSSSALRSPGTVFSVSVAVLGISDRLFLSFSGLLPLLFELISASERGSWVSAVLRLPARAPFGPLGSALRVPGPLPRAADVRLPADFWRRESGQLCRDLAFRTLFAGVLKSLVFGPFLIRRVLSLHLLPPAFAGVWVSCPRWGFRPALGVFSHSALPQTAVSTLAGLGLSATWEGPFGFRWVCRPSIPVEIETPRSD